MKKIGFIIVLLGAFFINACKVQNVKESLSTESKPEGFYSFKGAGHEPEWEISISDSDIVYSHINQPGKAVYKELKVTPIMDLIGMTYSASDANGNNIYVQVFKEDCRDIMEDKTWPARVELSVETGNIPTNRMETSLLGCGKFMDERLNGTWFLKSLNGKKIKVKDKMPQVIFNDKERSVSANMGCNGMGGSYELWNSTVYFNENYFSN